MLHRASRFCNIVQKVGLKVHQAIFTYVRTSVIVETDYLVNKPAKPTPWLQQNAHSPGDLEKRAHRVKVSVRWLTFSQFDCGDAERPDVTPDVIGVVKLLLTCYYLEAANKHSETCVAAGLDCNGNNCPISEVSYLYVTCT